MVKIKMLTTLVIWVMGSNVIYNGIEHIGGQIVSEHVGGQSYNTLLNQIRNTENYNLGYVQGRRRVVGLQ